MMFEIMTVILLLTDGTVESHVLSRPAPAVCNAQTAAQVAIAFRDGRETVKPDFYFSCIEVENEIGEPEPMPAAPLARKNDA